MLSLNRCRRLTTVGVLTLGRSSFFKLRLKRLNLGYNQYIHDEALAAFTVCNGLITLNLDHTDVSEQKALLLQSRYLLFYSFAKSLAEATTQFSNFVCTLFSSTRLAALSDTIANPGSDQWCRFRREPETHFPIGGG